MLEVLVAAETLLLILLALLVAGLLRSHAEILRRLGPEDVARDPATEADGRVRREGAEPAADVAGTRLDGQVVQVGMGPGGPSTLLAFLSSGCLTCETFWSAFQPHQRPEIPGGARLVVVTKDRSHESPTRLRELAPDDLPVVMSTAAWEAYDVPTAPYFVYVDGATGEVHGEGSAHGWPQVASLLRDALADIGDAEAGAGRPQRSSSTAAARAARIDRELERAGIGPGHPSLDPRDAPEERSG